VNTALWGGDRAWPLRRDRASNGAPACGPCLADSRSGTVRRESPGKVGAPKQAVESGHERSENPSRMRNVALDCLRVRASNPRGGTAETRSWSGFRAFESFPAGPIGKVGVLKNDTGKRTPWQTGRFRCASGFSCVSDSGSEARAGLVAASVTASRRSAHWATAT
jgi:hypothetical protein